jgi:hypothetical protein
MTIIVALAHAFRTNQSFEPEYLYIGAFMLDLTILEVLLG